MAHYPNVDPNPNFPELEKRVLAYWQRENIFARSVEERPASKEFVFYDGPPFANGLPHYGHLLTGYVKDAIARYQTMRGKRVERRFGWDCHGLPAEMGSEKELGISGRQAIQNLGIGKFNEHCRTSVMKYTNEWEDYVNRQARWVDFKNDYKTMDKNFMESVLWAFKQLYDKGLVYEAYRVMPYSWAAETPLSSFETKLDNSYREREDKAITVAFELNAPPKGAPKADKYFVLAWTTTPWTLPSNLALAVNKDIYYNYTIKDGVCYFHAANAAKSLSKTLIEGDMMLETPHFILREFKPEDFELFAGLMADKEVNALLKPVTDETENRKIFDGVLEQYRKDGFSKWAVFEKKTGAFVGRAGVNKVADVPGLTEVGYILHKQYWGKGYATELAKALYDYVFTHLAMEDISSLCHADNKPSATVMKKFGLTYKDEVFYPFLGDERNRYMISREGYLAKNVFKGSDLIGLTYKPLFPYFKDHPNSFRILDGSSFVTDADGTGIVHMAPGFGEDDQKCCEANGIELVVPVDGQGKFTDAIFDLPMPLPPAGGEESPKATQGRVQPAYRTHKLGESKDSTRKPHIIENARALRKDLTKAEKKLWYDALAAKNLESYKFRKQQPIGDYIADFVCMEKKLIIELDGGQHNEDAYQQKDVERTAYLESQGYQVLRFWNHDILENLEGVVETIFDALTSTPPYPPRKQGGANIAPPQVGGNNLLVLRRLNVIADTRKDAEEPYTEQQLKKFGLANLRIINYFKHTGQLIKQEDFKHNYPHCWRTDTPLIYRALPSWYVEVTQFRDRAVEINKQINWIPEHIRDGQMGHMLATAPDWSISRNRFWGTPIPVWKGDKGGIKVFGSIAELKEFFGTSSCGLTAGSKMAPAIKSQGDEGFDLHRPYIDQLVKTDEHGETWKRVEDVFDCWFESGSMPFAQVHYPFENKDWFETHFPADFITEYVGQTRGWFNTLIMLSTALFDKAPFKNCICHGVVLDSETGLKYSKRLKNYKDPMEVMDGFGADALRWLMLASPVMRGHDLSVDPEGKFIRDVVRLAIKPIWNAYNFFCMYANADGVKAKFATDSNDVMDRYILAKCEQAVSTIQTSLDAYDTPGACDAVIQFFEVLNNWYIRRSKERFWSENIEADPSSPEGLRRTSKQAAYDTLYTVLTTMCKAAAPLLPLTLEEIYRGLTGEASVHLADFPLNEIRVPERLDVFFGSTKFSTTTKKLLRIMDRVRAICSSALSIRSAKNIRVRQPLSSLTILQHDPQDLFNEGVISDIIKDEINVKSVFFKAGGIGDAATLKLALNNPILGKRLPEKMKQIIPASKKSEWKQRTDGSVEICGEKLLPGEYSLNLEPKPEYKDCAQALSTNDALVILDTNVTPELEAEGFARDLVRLIQQARKDAGLHVSDRIELAIAGDQSLVSAAQSHADYITQQTLSNRIVNEIANHDWYKTDQSVNEMPVTIALRKVA